MKVKLDRPRNADLFVRLVICGLEPLNVINRSNVGASLFGAVLSDASNAQSSIRLQLVQINQVLLNY